MADDPKIVLLRTRMAGSLRATFILFAVAATMAPVAAMAQGDGRSGKEVVDAVCGTCHATGANGSPKIGDRKAWSKRAEQGLNGLTKHALEGIRKMPAHGGNTGLSDLEIGRAVTYMVNQSGGHWVEPASVKDLAAERSGQDVVKGQCVKCHQAGVGGAPKIGDKSAWAPRMSQGIDNLVRSAIRGHGGMPPRGGEANLTDGELRKAILYMFDPRSQADSSGAGSNAKGVQPPVIGRSDPNRAVSGNVEVFLGIVSAQTIRSLPMDAIERTMHGGVPTGPDYYHLNISLRDRSSQAPIVNADVSVQIEQVGMGDIGRQSAALEPIALGGASYGAYVQLKGNTAYVFTVRTRTPRSPSPVEVRFEKRI